MQLDTRTATHVGCSDDCARVARVDAGIGRETGSVRVAAAVVATAASRLDTAWEANL